MNILEINKALSNSVRLNILQWLKVPEKHFEPHLDLGHFNDGVCVQHIRKRVGLSQSTVSHYLTMMHKANLITPTRHGKWTYYRRNEPVIQKYISELSKNL